MAWMDLLLGQREYVLQLLRREREALSERHVDSYEGKASKAVALDAAVVLLEEESPQ